MNWDNYIARHAGSPVWAMVFVDYALRARNDGGEFDAESTLRRFVSQMAPMHSSPDQFHKEVFYVALSLFGDDRARVMDVSRYVLQSVVNQDSLRRSIETHYRDIGWPSPPLDIPVKAFGVRPETASSEQSRTTVFPSPTSDDQLDGYLRDRLSQWVTHAGTPVEAAPEYYDRFTASARKKAERVLRRAGELNVDFSDYVVVSIGGADGTELEHILTLSNARVGILLEKRSLAIERARSKAESLRTQGKELIAIGGDAVASLDELLDVVNARVAAECLSGVAYTINATFHELPTRARGFDLRRFVRMLGSVKTPRLFAYMREPTTPQKWGGPQLRISSSRISPEVLQQFATIVCTHTGTSPRKPIEINEDTIILTPRQAIETLTKLFYVEDLAYEIGETITKIKVDEYLQAWRTEMPGAHVVPSFGPSESFARLYRKFGIRAFKLDRTPLEVPAAFLEVVTTKEKTQR